MNYLHRRLCRSGLWRYILRRWLIPWTLDGIDPGDCLLEAGPGPGLTTDVLSRRVARVTAIEIDLSLTETLKRRMAGSNVTVVRGDAANMPFQAESFSSVVALTMLHHMPSPEKQNRFFSEAYRVLRPGGVFAGIDHAGSVLFQMVHYGDTCTSIEPNMLDTRLQCAGFSNISVDLERGRFRFRTKRPTA